MKCDFCENKAKVFYTQLVDHTMKKVALCNSCADEQGISDPEGMLLSDQLFQSPTGEPAEAVPEEHSAEAFKEMMAKSMGSAGENILEVANFPQTGGDRCPACDFTLDNYQKVGRFGCPECYRTYRELLEKRLRKIHRGGKHEGRVPKGMVEQERLRDLLHDLTGKLEIAIEAEDYEEAATLRDQITQIEKQEAKRRGKEESS